MGKGEQPKETPLYPYRGLVVPRQLANRYKKNLIRRIEQRRDELGMTNADIARCVGVDRSTVGRWIEKPWDLPRKNVSKLCSALQCTEQYLCGETGEPLAYASIPSDAQAHALYDSLNEDSKETAYAMLQALHAQDALGQILEMPYIPTDHLREEFPGI